MGVSVHGSVLDLEVDTGAFPVEELRELLQSLHQKKRYHRLRDAVCCGWMTVWKGWTSLTTRWSFPAQS